MSKKSAQSLYLTPRRSARLAAFILGAHAAALVAALANGLPWGARAGLLALVLLSLWRSFKEHLLDLPAMDLALSYTEGGGWIISSRKLGEVPVVLLPGSVTTRQLAVLRFRARDGRRHHLILFRDALDEESYRRLRVLLRCLPRSQEV